MSFSALMISWNLEHIAVEKKSDGKYRFKRLSTEDTSIINDKNLTPLMTPIQSTAIRLTDAASDTAVAAARLAETQINNTGSKGLIQTGAEFIFGGG